MRQAARDAGVRGAGRSDSWWVPACKSEIQIMHVEEHAQEYRRVSPELVPLLSPT